MNRAHGTERMTVAQALIRFLACQFSERDGIRQRLIPATWGIFGHGNLAGIGQALQQHSDAMPFFAARNEQAMAHIAAGFAKARCRLATHACTTSIGPGATNLVTAAAGATINRVPLLLLPGDVFATRRADPVLQQLDMPGAGNVSVNETLRPVSRFFDRVDRPEQLPTALAGAMRTLVDPVRTGAVTIALPQDVQAEAHDFPVSMFSEYTWHIERPRPDADALRRAARAIAEASRPLIIAGGGVRYSEAHSALAAFVDATGIPVAMTQAGMGSLPHSHPLSLGAVGVTGSDAANHLAAEADLVIGIGTRYSDFTTASHSLFQDPDVRFLNVNVATAEAHRFRGMPVIGDARATIEELHEMCGEVSIDESWRSRAVMSSQSWRTTVVEATRPNSDSTAPLTQAQVIGCVNEAAADNGVVVCAAGSMPGDLHKLWRSSSCDDYHLEYGYSCMGYEIPGAMGVSLASPDRHVIALVGDGSWLMMPGEVATAAQHRIPLTIVLVDNGGYGSIGALSESVGSRRFGTQMVDASGSPLVLDYAAQARGLGATVVEVADRDHLARELSERPVDGPRVLVIRCDPSHRVTAGGAWWDVPVAEVSTSSEVQQARSEYDESRSAQRALD